MRYHTYGTNTKKVQTQWNSTGARLFRASTRNFSPLAYGVFSLMQKAL